MYCLAYVETEPVPVPNCVGWIKNRYDDVWLRAMTTVTAELIVHVSVLITTTKEPKDLYRKIFRQVLTFDSTKGELTPAVKEMVVIRRGGTEVNVDDLEPYIAPTPSPAPSSDRNSNRDEWAALITPDELDEDLAPIHVADAHVLEARMTNAILDFDREGEAVERSLAVEHSKDVCSIMDSFQFPDSAHRLDSLRA